LLLNQLRYLSLKLYFIELLVKSIQVKNKDCGAFFARGKAVTSHTPKEYPVRLEYPTLNKEH